MIACATEIFRIHFHRQKFEWLRHHIHSMLDRHLLGSETSGNESMYSDIIIYQSFEGIESLIRASKGAVTLMKPKPCTGTSEIVSGRYSSNALYRRYSSACRMRRSEMPFGRPSMRSVRCAIGTVLAAASFSFILIPSIISAAVAGI